MKRLVACIAVALLLAGCPHIAPVPTEAPMSCRELRMSFVKDTGHYELVKTVDSDAWVDNGANRWLNDGIRWLSMRCTPPLDETRFKVAVRSGAYSFDVPNVKGVKRLWLNNPDTGVSLELDKSDWSALRNLYGEVPGVIDAAQPEWFCRNPRLGIAPAVVLPGDQPAAWYKGIMFNPDNTILYAPIDAEGYDTFWSFTEDGIVFAPTELPDQNDGAAMMAYALKCALMYAYTPSATGQSSLNFNASLTDGFKIDFYSASVQDMGGGEKKITGASPLVDRIGNPTPMYKDGDGKITVALPQSSEEKCLLLPIDLMWDDITLDSRITISRCEVTDDEPVLADNFLLLPPADRDYTLEGIGSQYADALVNDDDVTWWTANHPSLVLRAAQMVFERMALRNESGARQFEPSLISDLLSIRYALAEEEMSGPAGNWIVGYER